MFFYFLLAVAGISFAVVKTGYSWHVAKKHMPDITFFEWYWGIAK
jgi:hypothetical protein